MAGRPPRRPVTPAMRLLLEEQRARAEEVASAEAAEDGTCRASGRANAARARAAALAAACAATGEEVPSNDWTKARIVERLSELGVLFSSSERKTQLLRRLHEALIHGQPRPRMQPSIRRRARSTDSSDQGDDNEGEAEGESESSRSSSPPPPPRPTRRGRPTRSSSSQITTTNANEMEIEVESSRGRATVPPLATVAASASPGQQRRRTRLYNAAHGIDLTTTAPAAAVAVATRRSQRQAQPAAAGAPVSRPALERGRRRDPRPQIYRGPPARARSRGRAYEPASAPTYPLLDHDFMRRIFGFTAQGEIPPDESDASTDDSYDPDDGLPVLSNSEPSDEEGYWHSHGSSQPAAAAASSLPSGAASASGIASLLSTVAAATASRLASSGNDRASVLAEGLIRAFGQGQFPAHAPLLFRDVSIGGGAPAAAAASGNGADGQKLRFKRDPKERPVGLTASDIMPRVSPISARQLAALVQACVKQYNFVNLSEEKSSSPPMGTITLGQSLRRATAFEPMPAAAAAAVAAPSSPSPPAFGASRHQRRKSNLGPPRRHNPNAPAVVDLEAEADDAAFANSVPPAAVVAAAAVAAPVAASSATVPVAAAAAAAFEPRTLARPLITAPAAPAAPSAAALGYSFGTPGRTVSSWAAAEATPPESTELKQLAAVFARPDVLGACFGTEEVSVGANDDPMSDIAPTSAASSSSLMPPEPSSSPIATTGPLDLLAVRTNFNKLFSVYSTDLSTRATALFEPELKRLFAILWLYATDPNTAKAWLGFGSTLGTDDLKPAGQSTDSPTLIAPDQVAAFEDEKGGKKRVRFTARGVSRSSSTTQPVSSLAAASSAPSVAPNIASLTDEIARAQDVLVRARAQVAAASAQISAIVSGDGSIYSDQIAEAARIADEAETAFAQLESARSEAASPTNTSLMHTIAPYRAAVPAMSTLPGFPSVPLLTSAAAGFSSVRRPSGGEGVVDLTLSDAEEEDEDERMPLPSSASTSFTQAPRLTISSLVAQQQQQDELRRQQVQHRQLQSPSASSIRSMTEYVAEHAPIVSNLNGTVGDRRVVTCQQCSRLNIVASPSDEARPCVGCGASLVLTRQSSVNEVVTSLAPSPSDDAMEVTLESQSAPAAGATPLSSPSSLLSPPVAGMTAPASVISDLTSSSVKMEVDESTLAASPLAPIDAGEVVALTQEPATSATEVVAAASPPVAASSNGVDASVVPVAAPAAPASLASLIVRSLVILLQLPQCLEPTSYVCRELWVLLPSLQSEIHDELVTYLLESVPSAVLKSELERWVTAVQSCISLRLATFAKQDQFLRGCVKSLALFHRINEALKAKFPTAVGSNVANKNSASSLPYLDRSAFLNDGVSSLESSYLAADYRHHLAGQEYAAEEARAKEIADRAHELDRLARLRASLTSLQNDIEEANAQPARKRMRTGETKQEHGSAVTAKANSNVVEAAAAAAAAVAAASSRPNGSSPVRVNLNATPVLVPRQFAFASYPFLFDASCIARILLAESQREQQTLIDTEMAMHRAHHHHGRRGHWHHHPAHHHHPNHGALILNVRREYLVADTLHLLQRLSASSDLKRPLKVAFINEEGIDAGGVKREFFGLLVRDLFSPDYNMFLNENEHYVFNPLSLYSPDGTLGAGASVEVQNTLSEYELVGIVLGLSIYNGVQLEVRFPRIVYKKLLARAHEDGSMASRNNNVASSKSRLQYTLTDLAESHPEVAKGLQALLEYPATTNREIEETFALDFTISHEVFGATVTRELIPGGARVPVTLSNRATYVDVYVRYMLHDAIAAQFDAFARGFFKVVSKAPLQLLSDAADLELLICGNQTPVWHELEQAATYDGWSLALGLQPAGPNGSSRRPNAAVISHFWSFFHSCDEALKLRILAFVTGSNRIPIKGLKHAKFVLMPGGDEHKLPESHTCFNQLVLPNYKDAATLRSKFLLALAEGGEGFQLR